LVSAISPKWLQDFVVIVLFGINEMVSHAIIHEWRNAGVSDEE
jgi:hypothetical protein